MNELLAEINELEESIVDDFGNFLSSAHRDDILKLGEMQSDLRDLARQFGE